MKVLKINTLKGIFLLSFLACFSFSIHSQSNTNSPYTWYGYGQIADQSSAAQRAMGGIGYGLRSSQLINPLNPASFSAVDSLTFMLDFGISGKLGWFEQGTDGAKAQKYNAGLEYVVMQFPLAKGLGLGLGFTPVTFVGYKFGNDSILPSGTTMYNRHTGSGGLSKVYAALSYRITKDFSAGVNIGYMFGDKTRDKSSVPSSNASTNISGDTLQVRALTYELGIQYRFPVNKTTEWIIGAVYTPKTKIGATTMHGEAKYDSNGYITGIPTYSSSNDLVFQFPETYAAGFTYHKLNKLTAGADFQYQRWAAAKFYDETNALNDRMKINAGVEYIPNIMNNKLFNRIRYRAGVYYSNSYVKIEGSGYQDRKYDDFGASLGLGIPMNDRRSFVNLAFQYSMLRPDVSAYIKEQYFKFTISYTYNELWFMKRKLQ
ncbi:membrane protein [Bacteroidia bacterium]|nr:membrane protein [Bacteroidia bacterium]